MPLFRLLTLLALVFCARPAIAFEPCSFAFRVDTQSSAFQALVDGAASRGGFWRPIREAPDDVQKIGRYVGRLDTCLMTPDGNPRTISISGRSVTLRSPHIASCTAALLPGNRLLTNHHCFFDPVLRDAGFSIVQEARINFGYISADFTDAVDTFLVSGRALAVDETHDAMVLQVIGGDANATLGGHIPMVMETEVTPRRALTMVHHPAGDPQQFSSGTCQVHPQQAALPDSASQLRHSCETTGGSSGALLLDARTLAVVGLHNQGGLGARGGFNGGHKIAMIEAALDLGFETASAPATSPAPSDALRAQEALADALARATGPQQRGALEAITRDFPGTRAAEGAARLLASLAPAPHATTAERPRAPDTDTPGTDILTVSRAGLGDFPTVADAVEAASPGSTIRILPGTYTGGVDVDKPLNFVGVGDRARIVMEADEDDVFYWTAREGRIENLTIRQLGGAYYALDFDGGSAFVNGIDVTSQGLSSVAIRNGGDPDIRKSYIRDGAQSGVYVYENGKGRLSGNRITDNGHANVSIKSGGNPTLSRNVITDGKQSGVYVYEGGLGVIENNEITDNANAGILVTEASELTVRRNTIKGNGYEAIWVKDGGKGSFIDNDLRGNARGAFDIESSAGTIIRRGNRE